MLTNAGKIRVLVIDDHIAMREGISALINTQTDMTVAGEASDGREAIEQFKNLQPDVSLVDWNLPKVRGEEVIASLLSEFPKARLIVITALDDGECIRRALNLGALAYLHKDTLRRELLPAIRAVLEGHQYLSEKVANQLKEGL